MWHNPHSNVWNELQMTEGTSDGGFICCLQAITISFGKSDTPPWACLQFKIQKSYLSPESHPNVPTPLLTWCILTMCRFTHWHLRPRELSCVLWYDLDVLGESTLLCHHKLNKIFLLPLKYNVLYRPSICLHINKKLVPNKLICHFRGKDDLHEKCYWAAIWEMWHFWWLT